MRHPFFPHAHTTPDLPPEVPFTPAPGPEIDPGTPAQPEIPPPLQEPNTPGIPPQPEITPEHTPTEIPDYDEGQAETTQEALCTPASAG